jgi:hypothetical protein
VFFQNSSFSVFLQFSYFCFSWHLSYSAVSICIMTFLLRTFLYFTFQTFFGMLSSFILNVCSGHHILIFINLPFSVFIFILSIKMLFLILCHPIFTSIFLKNLVLVTITVTSIFVCDHVSNIYVNVGR